MADDLKKAKMWETATTISYLLETEVEDDEDKK
jgi:hypothetical protein